MSAPIDAPRIRQLAEGIPGGLRELVELFISHTGTTMVELRAAVDGGNITAVGTLAHRCCGSAGAFGAARLLERLRALESAAKQGRSEAIPELVDDVSHELGRTHDALTRLLADEPARS
jgi:HPt (histidine-containing phosphotransfer) domain-containing protein